MTKATTDEAATPVALEAMAANGLGSTYAHSPDMLRVVERVMAQHVEKFRHLRSITLCALRRDSQRTDDAFAVDKAGGAFVRPDRERGIDPGYDAGIWFRGRWWDQMSPDQREAWTFHQLSHLQPTPKGEGIRKVGHDVEAFADEALHFGAWEESLTLWATNLDRHGGGGDERADAQAERALKRARPSGDQQAVAPTH